MLEIKNIDVFYGDAQALWDVSLTVEEGKSSLSWGPMGGKIDDPPDYFRALEAQKGIGHSLRRKTGSD